MYLNVILIPLFRKMNHTYVHRFNYKRCIGVLHTLEQLSHIPLAVLCKSVQARKCWYA